LFGNGRRFFVTFGLTDFFFWFLVGFVWGVACGPLTPPLLLRQPVFVWGELLRCHGLCLGPPEGLLFPDPGVWGPHTTNFQPHKCPGPKPNHKTPLFSGSLAPFFGGFFPPFPQTQPRPFFFKKTQKKKKTPPLSPPPP